MIQLLVDRGADVGATDEEHEVTPADWADYFGRRDLAEWLRKRE